MKKTFSPTKSKTIQEIHTRHKEQERKIHISKAADYHKYFCHYNNAVYMGGMSSQKKHGKGLLLHDDGSAVITDYLHDTPTGHSVIFRQNSITSMFYMTKTEFQVAYKQGKYIITIPFCDSSYKAHGEGVLINYDNFKIYRLIFKRGVLVQKIMHLERRDSEDVFNRNLTSKVIEVKHQQAFDLNFQKPNKVHIRQNGSKLTVGYFDQNGSIHGLSFTFYGQNLHTHGEQSLYLKFIEKGYYRDSNLETYGEKMFSNGNKYIGEFDKGQFHGYGLLISLEEMKWVYGKFNRGQLHQIIESNYKKFTEKEFSVWAQSLRAIHRRYRQRWIDLDIQLPSESYLYVTLHEVLQSPVSNVDPDQAEILRDTEARMSRIQHQFQKQSPQSLSNSFVQKQLDKYYEERSFGKTKLSIQSRAESIEDNKSRKDDYTTINKFEGLKSAKNSQKEFREEDPFKIHLTKVPFDSQTEEQNQTVQPKSRIQSSPSLKQSALRSSKEKHLLQLETQKKSPYSYVPQDYGYNNRHRFNNYIDTVYNSTFVEELNKQRERLNRLQNDQLFYNQLRRGLETSPVHRNYYSTPPKYQATYPQRYVGKFTNKRNFNYEQNPNRTLTSKYPTTSKYHPSLDCSSNQYELPKTSSRSKNSKKQRDESDNSKRRSKSPQDLEYINRNYIKNNYQYWKANS